MYVGTEYRHVGREHILYFSVLQVEERRQKHAANQQQTGYILYIHIIVRYILTREPTNN